MDNNLSTLMGRERITASYLHKQTGVSMSALHAIYYGKTKYPDTRTVEKLCNYFNCTFDEFFKLKEVK